MTWVQRLKRIFHIDIEVCSRCGGSVRVIVEASNGCIEDQDIMPDKAGQALASFRWKGVQHNSTPPSRKPVKTACHELSRAPVQE